MKNIGKTISINNIRAGDYVRWLKPMGNATDREYVYGLVLDSIISGAEHGAEPSLKILDNKDPAGRGIWLPIRLLVEAGSLQISRDSNWIIIDLTGI